MSHKKRLAPGERERSDGRIVTNFNFQLSPEAKRRLLLLAVKRGKTGSDLILAALYLAYPMLHPSRPEP